MLILWAFITNIGKNPMASYIPSLMALIIIIFPFGSVYPRSISKYSTGRWLILGFLFSCIFALYEISGNFFKLPELDKLLNFGLWERVINPSIMVIKRVKASMQEPSYYGIFLNFLYIVVDSKQIKFRSKKNRIFLKIFILIILISTVSLTGYFLIFAYYGAKLFLSLKKNIRFGFKVKPDYLLGIGILIILSVAILQNSSARLLVEESYGRVNKLYSVIQNERLVGSEGSRGNAIIIMGQYLAEQNLFKFLTGEGYANSDIWLEKKYDFLGKYSAYSRGHLPNMFANVGISMGFIGLIFFCIFLYSNFNNRTNNLSLNFKLFFFMVLFAHGSIISYLPWSILLTAKIILNDEGNSNKELSPDRME